MVFKRYIKKHGKKLGPYYYENVRGHDGKVKSIYLGVNPNHHVKHKVRKPLFFVILILVLILILGSVLFVMQNKSYLFSKASAQEPDFDIDQILLKVLVRSGEFIDKQIRIMNTGNELSSIKVEVSGLSDIVKIDDSSFSLKPGQTKVISLNFSSYLPQDKIEQQPGVYIGKLIVSSDKASKEIPIIAEIETKNVLFDMNLNPVAIERKVKQGSDTTIEVRLFNLESIESQNVDVEYFVKDINGNTIVSESETVVVKTQASFFKTLSIPKNLKPGPYIFAAITKFGKSVGTSSYMFEVIGPEEKGFLQFCKSSILCMGISFTTILLMFALMAYLYFFFGAYLYEKFTGATAKKPKPKRFVDYKFREDAAEQRAGFFNRVQDRIDLWKEKRRQRRAEKDKLEIKKELEQLKRQRRLEIERKKSALEEERIRQEALRKLEEEQRKKQLQDARLKLLELRRQEELRKKEELERKKAEEEEAKQELEEKKLREIEEKQKEEEKRQKRQKRKKKIKDFLRRISLYKAPEEKKQAALQKEKERLESLKRENELQRQRKAGRIKIALKKSKNLDKFQSILSEAKKAVETENISRLDRIYLKASELYTALDNREKQSVYADLMKLYEQRNRLARQQKIEEELQKKEDVKNRKDEEERKKQEERLKKQEKLERAKLWKKRRGKAKAFLHRFGLYKTPEEKKQAALQKEKERLESLKRENELQRQKEAEEKRKKEEERKELKDEKESKKREARKLEEQKKLALEEEKGKRDDIEREKKQREREEKQKESQRLAEEKAKAMQLEISKEIGSRLEKNRADKEILRKKLEGIEADEKLYGSKFGEIEDRLEGIEHDIITKSKAHSDLKLQKSSLLEKRNAQIKEFENRLKEEKKAISAKIKQAKEMLAEKEIGLMKKAEEELEKLGPEKRKTSEKWKRMEVRAKIKLEEQALKDELKVDEGKEEDETKKSEGEYKKAVKELNSRLSGLRQELEELKSRKEHLLVEKKHLPDMHSSMERNAKNIKNEILALDAEHEKLESELKKSKPATFGLFTKFRKLKSGKSIDKFRAALEGALEAIKKNDVQKAKQLYMEARNIYVDMEYDEKKEVYSDLMEVYNKLL
ncbi:hypothetical protein HYS31_01915 [Candidatus Woesearchaeota archaeon]|nr:hypothetical protein [Candidatus Woesearchaeota archaeon]